MNFETLCLKSIEDSIKLTGQQNIDADIILPDYYDTVGKIIKCNLYPVTEAVTTNGDKISISGIAKYSIVYVGEDKKMYCYENECKYTKVFQSKYAENCVSIKAEQTAFSLNCRATGPKRLEIRAVIQLNAVICNIKENTLISKVDDEFTVTKSEEITFVSQINDVVANFSVSNSFSSSDFKETPDVILKKYSKIKLSEIKTIHNKAYIKGIAETNIVYFSNETGNISTTILTIPVSEIIDIFGVAEDDICNVKINDIYTDIIIKENTPSDKSVELRLEVYVQATVSRSSTDKIVTDLYSTKNELTVTKTIADIITSAESVSKTEAIVFDTDTYEECSYTDTQCWIENIKISPEKRGKKYNLLITATFNALLKSENGEISVIAREHTFESEINCKHNDATLKRIESSVLSVSALHSGAGKIRFTADLLLEYEIHNICKVNGFTNVEAEQSGILSNNSKYIVYFAKQNEDVWSVAKENRTSVDKIKQLNNLTEDILSDDKMLLFPSF